MHAKLQKALINGVYRHFRPATLQTQDSSAPAPTVHKTSALVPNCPHTSASTVPTCSDTSAPMCYKY